MKKSLVILTFILLILPLVSAVEFDMKTEFNQGETLMAKVSGNFLDPILNNNIFFYRGHVRISMDSYVTKINNTFYIYASLIGKNQNNYSIVLKNARYYIEGGQISEEDITKNFSITKNISDFSIDPGFIVTKDNFFIEVQNLQDSEITIQIKTNPETSQGFFASLFGGGGGGENSITLKAGEIKKINFELNNITQPTLEIIELSTDNLIYELPVYIFTEETESEKKQRDFKFEPSELNISIPTNSNLTKIIYLYNTGQETLENISLSISDLLNPYVSLSIEEIKELEANSSIKIELYFFSDDEEKVIEGQIKAQLQELYSYSAVSLNFLKDYVPSDGEDEISTTKTCSEMNGTICKEDEKCDEETIYAKDSVCCLKTCKKIKKSQVGKIIGWMIVIAVLGFLVWFFKKKYRGVKREIDLFKPNQKQPGFSNQYENKIQKNQRPPSVRTFIRKIEKPVTKTVEKPIIKIVEKPVIREVEKKVFIEKPKEKIPKYVASTNTKKYHKSSCRLSKLIKERYKVSKNDITSFKKQGYKPCKICLKG